jgi:quinol monooxygenase YgiN
MINHIVLMKLNDRADDAVISGMRDYVAAIAAQLDQVRSYRLVRSTSAVAKGHDWAILSAFENEADIAAFRVAPLHQEFVAFTDPYTADYMALDYESASP